jgi:prenyltransferase beta subunit
MFERGNFNLRRRLCSGTNKTRIFALTILVLLVILNSLSPFTPFGSSHRLDSLYTSPDREQEDHACLVESYMTTRREAIVDYVQALQAPEGYFHAYLEDPPPFEPDGTDATFSEILDAYGTLKYIDRVDELDWSNTVQFLLSLVDDGFLNMSKRDAPSAYTCWTALTLLPNLDIDADIDVDDNAAFVASLQQPDGGFLAKPSNLVPTLVRTYYALDMLRIVGRLDLANLVIARSFVLSCYKNDGGFSNSPQEESDIGYTPAGIMLMEIIGLQDILDVNKTTSYLLQYWDNESGCEIEEDLLFTQRIAWSLWLLNRENSIDTVKLVQWVLSLQKHARGEFVGYPEADLDSDRLFYANLATHILAMYNGTDLLDSDFLVEEEPVWTIPQWWIDYINSEWGTISDQDGDNYSWVVYRTFVVSTLVSVCFFMFVIFLVLKDRKKG